VKTIFIINRIYNLILIMFFMGGSAYLVADKGWSLWTIVIAFLLVSLILGEIKVTSRGK
jgi:hypothetical protein